MRMRMEVNNVTNDERDDKYRNYLIKQLDEPHEGRPIPAVLKEKMVYIECNKRTNLGCINALSLDMSKITR